MELKLIEYIKKNKDWETKLTQKPYYLTIKRKDNLIMFCYSQIDSDFSKQIVRESRGIIFEDVTFNVVCLPFFKFYNYGETNASEIDWSTAKVQEKLDGSLIKLWFYDDEWRISTNGTIDAKDANLSSDVSEFQNFYDLFLVALKGTNIQLHELDRQYTFMFELMSPYNRVVVPHKDIKIRHIGTRCNTTLKEVNIDIGVDKPKSYTFGSIEECIYIAKELPFDQEGYVVVDNDWNRVKIKGLAYIAVHHLSNNGIVTKKRIMDLIKLNEDSEFLVYYPEFTEAVNDMRSKINTFIEDMDWCIKCQQEIMNKKTINRKKFAKFVQSTRNPDVLFKWLDGKISNTQEWLDNQRSEKIVELLEGVE